jgi:hypothetical protein
VTLAEINFQAMYESQMAAAAEATANGAGGSALVN